MGTGSFINATVTTENTALADAPAPFLVSVAEGGTGATTAADARTNLGLGDVATYNVLPISKGGTGAITQAQAKESLGINDAFDEASVYKSGDTIDLTGKYLFTFGYGQSSTMVQAIMPLPKKITATTITTTCSVAWVRGNGATLAGTIVSIGNGTMGDGQLAISISVSGAVTYQTYVAAIGNGTITFS